MSETDSSPKTRDAEQSRGRILDAAEALFLSDGFSRTALSRVAVRADVPKSLIFHYFPTKQALWEAVKLRRLQGFVSRQREGFRRGPVTVEELVAAIRDYFDLLRDDPAFIQLCARAGLEPGLNCARFDPELIGPFIARLEEAAARGLLRPGIQPVYLLALIIAAVTQWFEARDDFANWPGMPEKTAADPAYLETIIEVLLYGTLDSGAAR